MSNHPQHLPGGGVTHRVPHTPDSRATRPQDLCWYYSENDRRIGPVSLKKFVKHLNKIQPNAPLPLVWNPEMRDWKPADRVPGLEIPGRPPATSGPQVGTKTTLLPPLPLTTANDTRTPPPAPALQGSPPALCPRSLRAPGFDRATFWLFFGLLAPALFAAEIYLDVYVERGGFATLAVGACVPIVMILAMIERFRNLSMSPLAVVGLLVPGLNLWLFYRLFCCPPRYDEHQTIDPPGKLLGYFCAASVIFSMFVLGGLAAWTADYWAKLATGAGLTSDG